MSFADYGFDIFPYSVHHNHVCGGEAAHYGPKCIRDAPPFELKELDNLGNIYYNVIDNLVDLGINAENELILAKKELHKYKSLQQHDREPREVIFSLKFSRR